MGDRLSHPRASNLTLTSATTYSTPTLDEPSWQDKMSTQSNPNTPKEPASLCLALENATSFGADGATRAVAASVNTIHPYSGTLDGAGKSWP